MTKRTAASGPGARFEEVEGGITAAPGFLASGIHAGIKKVEKPDLALIVSEREAVGAGTFTTNRVVAPSVVISWERIEKGPVRAILINSGNANACTGEKGFRDALATAKEAARGLGVEEEEVCVASTGVIGQPLPMAKIREAIPESIRSLSREGGKDAAQAIMTTDTFPKSVAVRGKIGGRWVIVGGIAKGSGMIHPNMATMLAFITTDMAISRPALQKGLRHAVENSFNRITVDGDTSTNDMVLCLANGMSGVPKTPANLRRFQEMLEYVAGRLARMIIMDGEGATKFVEIRVRSARTAADAVKAAFAVAKSPLVKTTFFGEDPNWGRIMAALGYSGAAVEEDRVAISFGRVPVVRRGMGLGAQREEAAREVMRGREFTLMIDLGLGRGEATVWTSDLTYDYVKINVGYRS